jgi:RNA methyltransferase, TrmH family
MPISQRMRKFITSLQLKKYRKQEQCFVVQGAKSVHELLASDFHVQLVLATPDFLAKAQILPGTEVVQVGEKELAGLSEFQTNDSALAVAKMKSNQAPSIPSHEFALVLDDIRDPGNLGTIIRTADWFGISRIVASEETADFYNPKVISATMGSFVRVALFYTDLQQYLGYRFTAPILTDKMCIPWPSQKEGSSLLATNRVASQTILKNTSHRRLPSHNMGRQNRSMLLSPRRSFVIT